VAAEIGDWLARWRLAARVGTLVALGLLAVAVRTTPRLLDADPFRHLALREYTESAELNAAFAGVRARLAPDDRLAILGKCDAISPALFVWELGPPAGDFARPASLGHHELGELDDATRVLLLVPTDPALASYEVTGRFDAYHAEVERRVAQGALAVAADFAVPSRHLVFRLFAAATPEE
jgi:hypothetical protein